MSRATRPPVCGLCGQPLHHFWCSGNGIVWCAECWEAVNGYRTQTIGGATLPSMENITGDTMMPSRAGRRSRYYAAE